MIRVIGVRFRNVGKIYYFSPKNLEIKAGDHVIVETARGVEYGNVVLAPRDVKEEKVVQPLKDVIRIANLRIVYITTGCADILLHDFLPPDLFDTVSFF